MRTKMLHLLTLALFASLCVLGDLYSGGAKPKTDANGDPLPSGALARMGSVRLRHGDTINFVAFPPDGKTVLTASVDNTLRLWDRSTGKEIHRFDLGTTQPNPGALPRPVPLDRFGAGTGSRVAMAADGKTVAAIMPSNEVQIWSLETGKPVHKFKLPPNTGSILFSPDGKTLAARGSDRVTSLFDPTKGDVARHLKSDPVKGDAVVRFALRGGMTGGSGVAFSHDGKMVATTEGTIDMQKGYVRLSDTQTANEIRRIDFATSPIGVAFSPNGKMLAIAVGNSISFRDPDTGKEIRSINCPGSPVTIEFSRDSKMLLARGRDQVVRLFDADAGKEMHALGEPAMGNPNPNVAVNAVFIGNMMAPDLRDAAFSHDGKLISAGGAQTLRTWNTSTGKEQPLVPARVAPKAGEGKGAKGAISDGHSGPVSSVLITPDGKTMLTRAADNIVRRWNASTGEELGQFQEPRGTTGVQFSPDGKLAAFANADGSIRLHATDTGKEVHKFRGHQNGVAALAFSGDSKALASRGGADGAVRVYDVVKGGEIRSITLPGGGNPNMGPGAVVVDRRLPAAPPGLGLAFAPDGRSIAVNINASNVIFRPGAKAPEGSPLGTLRVFDIATAKEIRILTLPTGRVINSILYSPDGRLLAAENSDQSISLWELASGRERAVLAAGPVVAPTTPGTGFAIIGAPLPAQRGPVASAAMSYSPDGTLVAIRAGNNVRVFDVETASQRDLLLGHNGVVNTVAFAADGKTLASGSHDTTALVWDVAPFKRTPKPAVADLAAKDLDALWSDLISEDTGRAARGIVTLASQPKPSAAYLREHVKPAVPVDPKKIDEWLADLNDSNFTKRTKANQELERLGELAIPGLQKLLAAEPSLEARRRMEALLEKLTTGVLSADEIRIVRAIESLEKMNHADARAVLALLAQGAPGALATRHAQAALDRMAK